MTYRIFRDKEISALEYSSLMESVGWGSNYSEEQVLQSLAAYPFIAHARSETGALWGYVSAFSDRAFSTKPLGEAKHFFVACGYRVPAIDMQVLFKQASVVRME